MAQSKGRVVLIALTVLIVYFLFIASPTARSEKEYRQRTEDGLARRHSKLQGDISDEDWTRETNAKLQSILNNHPPGSRGDTGSDSRIPKDSFRKDTGGEEEGYDEEEARRVAAPVAPGRHRNAHSPQQKGSHADHARPRYPKAGNDDDNNESGSQAKLQKGKPSTEDPGKGAAREQLQIYLKNPIVIFSKSYCPHSKRAKQLLTQIYTITPSPLIVELDQLLDPLPLGSSTEDSNDDDGESRDTTTMGAAIQDLLRDLTDRRTVPNIMVGGIQSIGGNDLLWEMHEQGTLVSKIQKLVGKRVSMVLNPDQDS